MRHIKQWYLCKFKNACVEKYNEQEYIQIKDCTKHIGMSVGEENEGNGGRRRERGKRRDHQKQVVELQSIWNHLPHG